MVTSRSDSVGGIWECSTMAVERWQDMTRGTCPRCGSVDVVALYIGDHIGPLTGAPEWVKPVGCIHPGFDHGCETCDHTWTAGPDLNRS
jgi:hypothetical protein